MIETVQGPDGKEYPTGELEPRIKCSGCSVYKPLTDFHLNIKNRMRFGRAYVCRPCRSANEQIIPTAPNKREAATKARRALIAELHGQGLTAAEITEEIGVKSRSTVDRHLQILGLSGRTRRFIEATGAMPAPSNVKLADSAVRQLADMARLIHDGTRVVLQLEGLSIPPEMAAEWEKNLAHVGKALRYLRGHAKKGNT